MKFDYKFENDFIAKKNFNYTSNAWSILYSNQLHYIKIDPGVGMNPDLIRVVFTKVLQFIGLESTESIFEVDITGKKPNYRKVHTDSISVELSRLESNWYADCICYLVTFSNYKVLIEPYADGTQIHLFFAGTRAEQEYDRAMKSLQSVFAA